MARNEKGQFVKGTSGNPNGRPQLSDKVKEMLKAATTEAAQLLIDTMNNPEVKPELRVDCANEILNRVYGKPTQPIDGEVSGGFEIILAGPVSQYAH